VEGYPLSKAETVLETAMGSNPIRYVFFNIVEVIRES